MLKSASNRRGLVTSAPFSSYEVDTRFKSIFAFVDTSTKKLEFFGIDLRQSSHDLSVLVDFTLPSPPLTVAWGAHEILKQGILMVTLKNGSLLIYDPLVLLNNGPTQIDQQGLLSTIEIGAVNVIRFHPTMPKLVAAGGESGQVVILNVTSPSSPEVSSPFASTENECIVDIAWNPKVPHILASTGNGTTSLWDLKNKKLVISLKDPNRRLVTSNVFWHPFTPTQLVVSYNDDHNASLQFWDLRNCNAPVKEIREHVKGITCSQICPNDESLFVTSGRDNRTTVWVFDQIQGGNPRRYTDITATSSVISVAWLSGSLSDLMIISTSNGNLSVHAMGNRQTGQSDLPPPKYLLDRHVGITFGYGGRMACITFPLESQLITGSNLSQLDNEKTGFHMFTSMEITVVPDDALIKRDSEDFIQCLSTGNLVSLCGTRSKKRIKRIVTLESSSDSDEYMLWAVMMKLVSGSPKENFVETLGFSKALVEEMANNYLMEHQLLSEDPNELKKKSEDFVYGDNKSNSNFTPKSDGLSTMDQEQLGSLFDEIGRNIAKSPPISEDAYGGAPLDPNHQLIDWTLPYEQIIRSALLVGDISTAVSACFATKRFGDGLIIASSGGKALWLKARNTYMRRYMSDDTFMMMISNIITDNLQILVEECNLHMWKETLALLCTYSNGMSIGGFDTRKGDPQNSEFLAMCETLGRRLESEKFDSGAAVICYLLAGNFQETVRLWELVDSIGSPDNSKSLQSLVERMVILRSALPGAPPNLCFNAKLVAYANTLANCGRVSSAVKLLSLLPEQPSTENQVITILRDRIYHACSPTELKGVVQIAPVFPFEHYEVNASASVLQSHSDISPSSRHGISSNTQSRNLTHGIDHANITRNRQSHAPQGHQGTFGSYGDSHSAQHAPYHGTQMGSQYSDSTSRMGDKSTNFYGQSLNPTSSISHPGNIGLQTHGYPLNLGINQAPQAYTYQDPDQGMAVTRGYSTAPHASAVPSTAGLPVPWPVPTPAQQIGHTNTNTIDANKSVYSASRVVPKGSALREEELNRINSTLCSVAEMETDTIRKEDLQKRIQNLLSMLKRCEIEDEVVNKVLMMITHIANRDTNGINVISMDLTKNCWTESTKSWIIGLKRLTALCTGY